MGKISHFQFSQASLQDYVDCPRRFQLRYLLRLAWPAVEAQPALENERHLQQGAAFHRLLHQHALGVEPQQLSGALTDADLRRWWHNYLEHGPQGLPTTHHPEIILSAPLAGHRLIAKYDLIATDPGRRAVIVDWKTSRRRPRHEHLAERLQTRVYAYLLVQAGAHLNDGRAWEPEQVEMVYWFAEFPDQPARFAYGESQCEQDGAYLSALIQEIAALTDADEDWPLTDEERRCRFCPYRSLCQRGIGAGSLADVEDEAAPTPDLDIALDLEQIAEIEY